MSQWQSTHTKKDSIMHELTPTAATGPATTHSANISGKEVNSIVLSLGLLQSLSPAQHTRLQWRPKCPSRAARRCCSCSAASRNRCGLSWQVKHAGCRSSPAKESSQNSQSTVGWDAQASGPSCLKPLLEELWSSILIQCRRYPLFHCSAQSIFPQPEDLRKESC